jgi:protease-4
MRFAVFIAVFAAASAASAQVDTKFAQEPTGGIYLPGTPLAGEHDARAVTVNPGGLALLRGPELGVALDLEDSAVASASGTGFGTFLASSVGGRIVPRFGLGLGLEWLRPSRDQLAPDPGNPFRFTLSSATSLSRDAGLGVAWHHFTGEGALGGVNTFDLGLSTRWGNHVAVGAVVRDLATSPIAGTPVQRRYELESVVRPLATDRLELAIGGRLGETRLDFAAWGRAVVRASRGVYVLGQVETRDLHELQDSVITGHSEHDGRETRATLGVELSFGRAGVATLGTGVRDYSGHDHALATTFYARASAVGSASMLGRPDHIERVELAGEIRARELTQLVVRLRGIAQDPSAKAAVVVFDGASAGMAALEELRGELLRVRRAGKKVFAYMVSGTGRDYFVATAADRIYVDPAGGVRLVGIAGTMLYFRGVLDQIGVVPQFEKIAEFKSAPEQFTNTGPSEPAAKMHNDMFDSLWDRWLAAVADGRHLTKERVQALVDAGPYTAGDLAGSRELVDAVGAPDKIAQLIDAELHGSYAVEAIPPDRPERWHDPAIAIVYVDGDIVDGKSKSIPFLGGQLAGSETIVEALTAARNDPRVGAIVLRIDSPGGSALASELIAREVFATRGVKPILCSMSNLAASGGYFVAAGCDQIFAEPMTITGSIGIFSGKFDTSGLLKKLGVTTDTYRRGKRSDLESFFRPYTEEERSVVMGQLRYMYSRFIGSVAEGRNLSKDAVDAVGRGHVFTGVQAQSIHLVDRFGGLGDAIDEAKREMGLASAAKVHLVELPEVPASLFGVLGSLLGASDDHAASLLDLPAIRELVRSVPASLLVSPNGAQARLPYDLVFE